MVWIIISVIVTLFIIGFFCIKRKFDKCNKEINFLGEYLRVFNESLELRYANEDLFADNYNWLIKNSFKVQNMLGRFGLMHYRAPFGSFESQRYQMIVNSIPKIDIDDIDYTEIKGVRECLLRYIGVVEDRQITIKKQLDNPLKWLLFGVRQVLGAPILLLSSFGLVSSNRAAMIKNNKVFCAISGLIAATTFVSGVVTIIAGRDKFVAFIVQLFN